MSWILIMFINVVVMSVASLYQKIAMREEKTDAVVSAIIFQFLISVIFLVFAIYRGFQFPSIDLIPYFIGSVILYPIGTILFFTAIKQIEASEMSIIGGIGPVVTVIVSIFFLKDAFTISQLIGVLAIVSAVIIINIKRKGFVINQGTWLALLGTACYGVAVIFDTVIIHNFEVASFIPLSSFGSLFIMMIIFQKKAVLIVQSFKIVNKALIFYSILYAIGGITFYLALGEGALVGQVSSIARASIILTVILSTIFLGERTNILKKLFGAILTTIGVILVSQ